MKVATSDPERRQSLEDIRHIFNNWKLGQVKHCVDYYPNNHSKYDLYSIPYHFCYIYNVGYSFRGHLFKCVTRLRASDQRSFEHDLFYWTSNIFSNLKYLDNTNDQHSFSVAHYPNLLHLNVRHTHIDYINQFLRNKYTRISQPCHINVGYEHIIRVTNDTTRLNCSQIECHIINKPFVYPENFYHYFPLL